MNRIILAFAISTCFIATHHVDAFVGIWQPKILAVVSTTSLHSTPQRQPRRMMKKRRRRERKGKSIEGEKFAWETAETRPLVKSVAKEAGQDYWIDPQDLEKERVREAAIKNRKALEGEVPKEKLMSEVTAPYKQNWIGYFSVFVAILSVIVIKFPELLDQPKIIFPDL